MARSPQGGRSQFGADLMRMMGNPSRALKWLMGIEVVLFLAFIFGGQAFMARHVAMTPARVLHGEVWQVVSYMLVHATPQALLLNLLGLWMFGATLEQEWSPRRLLIFLGVTGLAGALAVVGAASVVRGASLIMPMAGLSASISAMVVAFGLLFPSAPIYFLGLVPIQAKWLSLGLVALILLGGLAERNYVGTFGQAIAMGIGALLVTGLWRPRILWARLRLASNRRKLKVLQGGAPSRSSKQYLN